LKSDLRATENVCGSFLFGVAAEVRLVDVTGQATADVVAPLTAAGMDVRMPVASFHVPAPPMRRERLLECE
jgi:hypothetical protein